MSSVAQFMCPRCHLPLRRPDRPATTLQCEGCRAWLRVSRKPVAAAFLVSLIASLLIAQFLGLKAYAAIFWIPIFAACLRFVPVFVVPFFSVFTLLENPPPKSGRTWRRHLAMFLGSWAAITFVMLVYGFIMGWGAFLLGSSRQDLREIADMWSVPLGWVNSAFIVRPEKSFVAVLGIVAANCYFYTLGIVLAFQIVHGFMQRNRTIQLGISNPPAAPDDDDDL